MKKLISILAILGILTFGVSTQMAFAQDDANIENTDSNAVVTDSNAVAETDTVANDAVAEKEEAPAETQAAAAEEEGEEKEESFHQVLKKKFIEGDAFFMSFVLVALILGLAFAIERILYLMFSYTNTTKLLNKVEQALENGGVEEAKEVCRNTRGPVASIFYQGLDRANEGMDMVEKSIESYGSVQMGRLESNLSWISLFIALAPMLGFMGTVIGMIQAFDDIQAMGDISPQIVAGGIKMALLTTVFGLITAIILQIFYNFIVSIIDSMVNKMEDATISLIDILIKFNEKNN